jgi:hypothetical protein
MSKGENVVIPPVLSVTVEDSMDIMIARDTARRAAALLGFAPAYRAQLAGAAGALAELVLKTNMPYEINYNGVQHEASSYPAKRPGWPMSQPATSRWPCAPSWATLLTISP